MENAIANATYNIGMSGLSLTAKGLPAAILYFGTGTALTVAIAGVLYHIVDYFQDPMEQKDLKVIKRRRKLRKL